MATRRSFGGAVVFSLFALNAFAAPSLDDVFKVRMKGEGSCDKYHGPNGNGQLGKMFDDMQKILHETNGVVEKDYDDWDDTARSLAASFFGLQPDDKGKQPAADTLDGKVMKKMKGPVVSVMTSVQALTKTRRMVQGRG